MTKKVEEVENLTKEIQRLLYELESYFWDVSVSPAYGEPDKYSMYLKDDKKTWLFYGTRQLFYKICVFLELKEVPVYLKIFTDKFSPMIDDKVKVLQDRGPLYEESEPSMIIHDDFRDFLSAFQEFQNNNLKKHEVNKLKLILENTFAIISKTNTTITNETSIYTPVRWYVQIIYPTTRGLNKARFIQQFSTYQPDILIPEISSAVEYKYIRKGENPNKYLDQIKTDADNYTGDPQFKFFYAVVFFEDKADLNQATFMKAVDEKTLSR